jgi:mevalonate kinase
MTIEERINELGEKYEKQKEINKELVDENEALKFAARMSEKVEKQLREKNKNLEARLNAINLLTPELEKAINAAEKMQALESENSEKLKADERFSVTTLEIDEGE